MDDESHFRRTAAAKIGVSGWAINNPLAVSVFFLAVLILGLVSYAQIPVRQEPRLHIPSVSVQVSQSGAAADEIENQITRPVEDRLISIPGAQHVTSTINPGVSVTSVEFPLGTDLQKATDNVRTAIDQVRAQLPSGVDPPLIQSHDTNTQPLLIYSVSSKRYSTVQITAFLLDEVSRAIQSVPGVSSISLDGAQQREILVALDPLRMNAFRVTAPQISQALADSNVNETGGLANVGGREQTIRVVGQNDNLSLLRNMTLSIGGRFIRLGDVAEIGDGQSEPTSLALYNGRPVVGLEVDETYSADELKTAAAVEHSLAKLHQVHPDINFSVVIDRSKITGMFYASTKRVLLEGIALAVVVVALFLRDWRGTLITALAMPISLIPTFFGVRVLGFSFDQVSLLALTLVVGILVDDAIVEIENIEKRLIKGSSPYRAALEGSDAIGLAVVATTLSIVAVFAPVSFMSGIAGQYFREFGFTVSIAVLFSLLVARLLIPLSAAYFLTSKQARHDNIRSNDSYKRALAFALNHRLVFFGIGAASCVISLFVLVNRPLGFSPAGDPGFFYVSMDAPPGSSRDTLISIVQRITNTLLKQHDVRGVYAQLGADSGSTEGEALNNGVLTVLLTRERHSSTLENEQIAAMKTKNIADVRVSVQGASGTSTIEEVLSSQDSKELTRAQAEVVREMQKLPGFSNVHTSPMQGGQELLIRPKIDEAARDGVTTTAIAQVLRVTTIGDIDANVAKLTDKEQRIPIRVEIDPQARRSLSTIGQLLVPATGGLVPISSVADLGFMAGPTTLVRYGRERRISIKGDISGLSLSQAIQAMQGLPALKHLPSSVHAPQVGDSELLSQTVKGFISAIILGVGCLYGVLILLFRGFLTPVIVLLTLPLGLIGATLSLYITGLETDLPVFIGLLMLVAVSSKNSILLVEAALEGERSGQPRLEALKTACEARARPIVMTTLAMIAGMLPTAIGLGEGAEFRRPMAITVIGGLVSSTALSLFIVPIIFSLVDDVQTKLSAGLRSAIFHADDA